MWPKGKTCPLETREKISASWSARVVVMDKRALCHPERKYFAKDKCRNCYNRDVDMVRNRTEKRKGEQRTYAVCAWRRKTVGVSPEEYAVQLAHQKGLCAICDKPPETGQVLCLDHDHVTGKPRGLVCRRCNLALGLFKDNIEVILRALDYLAAPPWRA